MSTKAELVNCQCEHVLHETRRAHPHLGVPANPQRVAMHVGPVCDDCAYGHLADYMRHCDQCGSPEHWTEEHPALFGWSDFEPEPDLTGDGSGDPDKQILTIGWKTGSEELAVIVHRTCHGKYPIDGPTADRKRALATHIVSALNAYDQPLPQYTDFIKEGDPS